MGVCAVENSMLFILDIIVSLKANHRLGKDVLLVLESFQIVVSGQTSHRSL
jgi:hypothetical protein